MQFTIKIFYYQASRTRFFRAAPPWTTGLVSGSSLGVNFSLASQQMDNDGRQTKTNNSHQQHRNRQNRHHRVPPLEITTSPVAQVIIKNPSKIRRGHLRSDDGGAQRLRALDYGAINSGRASFHNATRRTVQLRTLEPGHVQHRARRALELVGQGANDFRTGGTHICCL